MTDRRRNGFHGDPILVGEGPFCEGVSRSASSLKLPANRDIIKSWWERAHLFITKAPISPDDVSRINQHQDGS